MAGNTHLFVDGNSYFHACKGAGRAQSFDALALGVAAMTGVEEVSTKNFYTRPPVADDGKRVVGWLRAHGWSPHLYTYDYTHQDSLYVTMISDLHTKGDQDDTFVIVSGSGTLVYPLTNFTRGKVILLTNPVSLNQKLAQLASVSNGQLVVGSLMDALDLGGSEE